jgi:hypothetical protein
MRVASADGNISGIVMRRVAGRRVHAQTTDLCMFGLRSCLDLKGDGPSRAIRLYGIAELPIWSFFHLYIRC